MMSLGPDRGDRIGAALLDLTTGDFTVAEYAGPSRWQAIDDELRVLAPRELVVPAGSEIAAMAPEVARASIPVTTLDDWQFDADRAQRTLSDQLRTASLDGFGLSERTAAIQAAGGLVAHLRDTQKADLAHVRTISLRQQADYLLVDPTTIKHLGVVEGTEGGRAGSLLDELDATVTSMGGRLLRSWLLRPLLLLEPIRDRLDAVEELAFRGIERAKFREALKAVHDLERLVARAALGVAGPRDLVALKSLARGRPARAAAARRAAGAADPEPDGGARRPAGAARRARARAAGRAARPGAGWRRDSRRRGHGARRPPAHQPIRQAGHRGNGGRRAGAHRHRVAQDPLQPRLRVLHRDLEGQPPQRPGRLPPQADHRGGRALHHARAQGIRGEGPRGRRANSRARAAAVRGAARARGGDGGRHPADLAGAGEPGRAGRAGRLGIGPQLHQAARARGRRDGGRRRAPPCRRAAHRQLVRAERHDAERDQLAAGDPDRARTWAASPRTCGRRRCSA